jgi:predicted phage gp36 major capsid-like protein
LELGFKDKLDAEKKERVKAITQAKDKLKAESRNALDNLRNENLRSRADFEREKKSLI